jgi:hypothetical protein
MALGHGTQLPPVSSQLAIGLVPDIEVTCVDAALHMHSWLITTCLGDAGKQDGKQDGQQDGRRALQSRYKGAV